MSAELTHEVTPRCETCDVELPAGRYARNADHETTGYCAPFVATHLAVCPEHRIAYRRETVGQAEARRTAEADEAAREVARTAALLDEQRSLTSERRATGTTAPPGRLYIPGRA